MIQILNSIGYNKKSTSGTFFIKRKTNVNSSQKELGILRWQKLVYQVPHIIAFVQNESLAFITVAVSPVAVVNKSLKYDSACV